MNYFIKRELNEYGPYTLADLQRYVASGNIQMTDLARSEGMTEWVPVAQVVGNIAVPVPLAPAANVAPGAVYPDPPNLHWGIVVLLSLITCLIFAWVWAFVQAVWVHKVRPDSKAVILYAAGLALWIGAPFLRLLPETRDFSLIGLAWIALVIITNFSMKSSIEEHYNFAEPIGLQLSGVMTFFFGIWYFQYHFTRINEMKRQRAMGIVPGA